MQVDEYGGGDPQRVHAQLFADALQALGLDATYGAYVDGLPGIRAHQRSGMPKVSSDFAARSVRRARCCSDDPVGTP